MICNTNVRNLSWVKKDTFELQCTFYTDDAGSCCWVDQCGNEVGTPINLTGATIIMTSATGYNGESGSVVLWTISTLTGDIVLTYAEGGQFSVIVPTTATQNIVGTQLISRYDLVIELPEDTAGKAGRYCVLRGRIQLISNITA